MPEVEMAREAIVVRFRPMQPDAVLKSAQKEFVRTGHHRVSVFADVPATGESEHDVHVRLLAAAEAEGISAETNAKYWVCTDAAKLLDGDFTFHKYDSDEEPDEPAEHYSVDLGASPTVDDAVRFVEVFGDAQRRPA